MNTLSTNSIAADIVDTARSTIDQIDIIDFGDLGDAVTDTATDVVDVATQVTATGGRIVVRTARAGGRLVRRHPKGSLGILAILAVAIAAAAWLKQRNATTDTTTHLQAAA